MDCLLDWRCCKFGGPFPSSVASLIPLWLILYGLLFGRTNALPNQGLLCGTDRQRPLPPPANQPQVSWFDVGKKCNLVTNEPQTMMPHLYSLRAGGVWRPLDNNFHHSHITDFLPKILWTTLIEVRWGSCLGTAAVWIGLWIWIRSYQNVDSFRPVLKCSQNLGPSYLEPN